MCIPGCQNKASNFDWPLTENVAMYILNHSTANVHTVTRVLPKWIMIGQIMLLTGKWSMATVILYSA